MFKKFLIVAIVLFGFTFSVISFGAVKVSAATDNSVCGFLPCSIAHPCLTGDCGNGTALTAVGSALEIGLSFIFVGILIYGIWIILQAVLKIIRSNGDEEQIQSGYKLIKGAYTGIILIFVGIIGLVIIFAFFNATDIFKVSTGTIPEGVTLQ